MEYDEIFDLFFENIKQLFFPENWLQMDLKFSKLEIFSMLYIDKQHEITMTEIAESIQSPMSTANGVIERLVKKGYVERDRSDSDRRIVVLRLTEDGSRLIVGFKETISAYLKIALAELSEEEVKTIMEILLKVVRGMQKRFAEEQKPESAELKKIVIE